MVSLTDILKHLSVFPVSVCMTIVLCDRVILLWSCIVYSLFLGLSCNRELDLSETSCINRALNAN